MGIRLIIYLDDILILHQAKDQLELLVPQVCQLFEALGLLINKKKSLLIPAQCLEFLGFQICSCTLVISVPKEKLCKISQDAYRLLHQMTVSVRELARFVGKGVATVRGISVAPLDQPLLMSSGSSQARIVLLTLWWSTQLWFPDVLGMLEDNPHLLPDNPNLVSLPVGHEFILSQGVPQLIAWPISDNPSHHRAFLEKLQNFSSHHGDQR